MTGAFQSTAFAVDAFQVDVFVGGGGSGSGGGASTHGGGRSPGGGKKLRWDERDEEALLRYRKRLTKLNGTDKAPEEIKQDVYEIAQRAIADAGRLPEFPTRTVAQILYSIDTMLNRLARLRDDREDDERAAEMLLLT